MTAKRTGAAPVDVSLDGYLFGWADDQPALFSMPGVDVPIIACFTSAPSLRAFHERAGVPFERIKQIDNGAEFLESVDGFADVILDPHYTPEGRVRFRLVQLTDWRPMQ